MTGGISLEGVVTTQPLTTSSMDKGFPSGEMAGEAKQAVKDVESVLASTSSVVQDPEATQSPVPKDPS